MLKQIQTKNAGRKLVCLVLSICLILGASNVFGGGPNSSKNHNVPPDNWDHMAYVANEIVIKLNSTNPGEGINEINTEFGTETIRYFPRLGIFLLRINDGSNPITLSRLVGELDIVSSAQPNYLVDPMQPVQGSFAFPDENYSGDFNGQPAADMLNLNEVHTISTGENVRVAVIDGGINYSHPAFENMALSGYDYVDDDNDAFDEPGGDNSGHGTFVAGVIHLIAPDAEIYGYRVCTPSGEGDGYLVAEAIMQAVEDGCLVINLSLAMTVEHNAIADAILYAKSHEIIIVAASGNYNPDSNLYPACDKNVIAVGAVGETGDLAEFTHMGNYIDVLAPGENIYSPYLEDQYAWWSGSSFAAPFVSGQAALLLSKHIPYHPQSWVVDAITNTSKSGIKSQSTTLSIGVIDPLGSLAYNASDFGIIFGDHEVFLFGVGSEYYVNGIDRGIVIWSTIDPNNYTIEVEDTPEFLRFETNEGQTPNFHPYRIEPYGLPPGIYQDTFLVYVDGVYNSPLTQIVTIEVINGDLPLTAVVNYRTAPDPRVPIYVIEGEGGQFNYDFSICCLDEYGTWYGKEYTYWLSESPTFVGMPYVDSYPSQSSDGKTCDILHFDMNIDNSLPLGTYYDTIYVNVEGASNNPIILPYELNVVPDPGEGEMSLELVGEYNCQYMTLNDGNIHILNFGGIDVSATHSDTINVAVSFSGGASPYHIDLWNVDPDGSNIDFINFDKRGGLTNDVFSIVLDWQAMDNSPGAHTAFYYVFVEGATGINSPMNLWIGYTVVENSASDNQDDNVNIVSDLGNYPNPFNPITDVRFTLSRSTQTSLTIYNLLGQQVKQLVDQTLPAGQHSFIWNGKNANGFQVASGMYLYRLVVDDQAITKKMLLLK